MTIAQRYRPGRIFSRPLETVSAVARSMLRYLDALGLYAGDRLADLLSRQQLIRALADGANPRTQSAEAYVTGETHTSSPEEDGGAVHRMHDLEVPARTVVISREVVGTVSTRELRSVDGSTAAGGH